MDAEPLCASCGQRLERVVSAADMIGYRLATPEGDLPDRIRNALAGDDPPRPPAVT